MRLGRGAGRRRVTCSLSSILFLCVVEFVLSEGVFPRFVVKVFVGCFVHFSWKGEGICVVFRGEADY